MTERESQFNEPVSLSEFFQVSSYNSRPPILHDNVRPATSHTLKQTHWHSQSRKWIIHITVDQQKINKIKITTSTKLAPEIYASASTIWIHLSLKNIVFLLNQFPSTGGRNPTVTLEEWR